MHSEFDDFDDLVKATEDDYKFWQCPNGHYYIIGDCAKPKFMGKCHSCNADIGGTGYTASAGNTMASGFTQQVQTGYRYVVPARRDDNPHNIRNLGQQNEKKLQKKSVTCLFLSSFFISSGLLNSAILRLLLDCTLYIASKERPTETNRLLSVQIADEHELSVFFYDHVQRDIRVLANCLRHSPDESILLMHFALNKLKLESKEYKCNQLASKEDRLKFETKFANLINNQVRWKNSF
jgi:hypothetical protein